MRRGRENEYTVPWYSKGLKIIELQKVKTDHILTLKLAIPLEGVI